MTSFVAIFGRRLFSIANSVKSCMKSMATTSVDGISMWTMMMWTPYAERSNVDRETSEIIMFCNELE